MFRTAIRLLSTQSFLFSGGNFIRSNSVSHHSRLASCKPLKIVQTRQYALSPPPKLKTYGILHSNVRQLLRVIHPDTFRPHIQEDNKKSEEYKKLAMINQRSMQGLNSFNTTMKNYGSNMNTFLKGNGERIPLEFHIITNPQKSSDSLEIKTIRTAFLYPHVTKQIWVRHNKAEAYFYHWRDIQLLDLLHRVHVMAGSSLNISLLPDDSEIDLLRAQSRHTRIPLPINCKFFVESPRIMSKKNFQDKTRSNYEKDKC